jgi:hypothetical protein
MANFPSSIFTLCSDNPEILEAKREDEAYKREQRSQKPIAETEKGLLTEP